MAASVPSPSPATSTSPDPAQFRNTPALMRDEIWTVKVRKQSKKPVEDNWTEIYHSPQEGIQCLEAGYNCGIQTGRWYGRGELYVLDIESLAPEIRDVVDAELKQLPETLTVRTGGGGYHYYLEALDRPHSETTNLINLEYNGVHVGELRGKLHQVLAPGAIHPNGNMYVVVKNLPIATIEYSRLIEILKPFIPNKRKQGIQRCADVKPRTHAIGVDADVELDKRCQMIAETPAGERNLVILAQTYYIGGAIVGALEYDIGAAWSKIQTALETANKRAEQMGWPPLDDHDYDTARRGLERGYEDYLSGVFTVEQHKKRATPAQLLDIAHLFCETWHTKGWESYITINEGGRKRHLRLRDEKTRSLLYAHLTRVMGRAPTKTAIEELVSILEGEALTGPEDEIFVRVAKKDDKIYVDLHDDCSGPRYVEVSREGWQVVSDAPVKFYEPKGARPLPTPSQGGCWDRFMELFNLTEEQEVLLKAWLVQVFWPDGPYAHLCITGEQGSGKSVLQKLIKRLIDPCEGETTSEPKSERDLVILARDERIPNFENLSKISGDLSDALCRLSSGDAIKTRKLYTNDELSIVQAARPCIYSGIALDPSRGDLADRTIVLELKRIEPSLRKTEHVIDEVFEDIAPYILGLILDATTTGLRRLRSVELKNPPRMADFAEWVCACSPALGFCEDDFLDIYRDHISEGLQDVAAEDVIGQQILIMSSETRNEIIFRGTAVELLDMIATRAGAPAPSRLPPEYPKTPKALGKRLKRIAPALREHGIKIEQGREWTRGATARVITISRCES